MSKPFALSTEFLDQLRSLFPGSNTLTTSENPWYLVAAVALSASNRPEAVAQVLTHAIRDVPEHTERIAIARKIRDGLFKSGLISGYPKVCFLRLYVIPSLGLPCLQVINSLVKLKEVTPPELLDTEIQRYL
jgi:hypothetical protein